MNLEVGWSSATSCFQWSLITYELIMTPVCDNGGSFWKVGITADLLARVAMPIFQGLWTFHI